MHTEKPLTPMWNHKLNRAATYAAALSAIALAPFTAQAQNSSDVDALREQIRQLDPKLRVLERNLELKEEAAVAAAKKQPTIGIGPGGLSITSAEKDFSVRLGALIQVDSRAYFDDGATQGGIGLRRIRTPLSGTVGKNYTFNITPEYGAGNTTSSSVELVDAWFAAKLTDNFSLKFGKFTSPVQVEPGANAHFVESPFTNYLAPNRDLGFEATGKIGGAVDYRLGVFGGAPNNTTAFKSNAGRDLSIAGRLSVTPTKGLTAGVGFSVGNDSGTSQGAVAIINNAGGISSGGGSVLGAYTSDGTNIRLNPSIEYYPGTPVSAVAEYAWQKVDVVPAVGNSNSSDVTNQAWRLTAGYVLTGEARSKGGVTPKSDFDFASGTWGAFEVVARVGGFEADSAFTANVDATHYGIGLNWYLNRNARFLFNIEQTEFSGPGAAAINGGEDQLAFLSRFQLQF